MPFEYLLGGSDWAGPRLRYQYGLTMNNFNEKRTDPAIPIQDGMVIADVATGTGVWALEIADQCPGAKVEGLDINLDLTPAKGYLHPNVSFRKFDFLKEVGPEFRERYDVVNVQYINPVVADEDFEGVLCRFLHMLKPGGWLQWTDVNTNKWSWITPGTTVYHGRQAHNAEVAPVLVEAIHLILQAVDLENRRQTWLDELESRFQGGGLESVKLTIPKSKPSTLQPIAMDWVWVIDELSVFLREQAPAAKRVVADRWFELRSGVLEEIRKKEIGLDMAMMRCVGRKPYA